MASPNRLRKELGSALALLSILCLAGLFSLVALASRMHFHPANYSIYLLLFLST